MVRKNADNIRYKYFDDQDGPTYTILKQQIASILYEDGEVETFVSETTSSRSLTPSTPTTPTQKNTTDNSDATIRSKLIYKSANVFQDGLILKAEQVRELMSDNSEALNIYNRGKSLNLVGKIIAYPSAFMLGWDLGSRIAGGEGNNTFLAVGAVGTAVGLIIGISGENRIKKSVLLYNSKASNNALSYQVNFGFTQTGIGFSMQF